MKYTSPNFVNYVYLYKRQIAKERIGLPYNQVIQIMKKMNQVRKIVAAVVLLLLSVMVIPGLHAQDVEAWEKLKGNINIFWCNDMGRNGYYDQKPIAELMGDMADAIGPECIIAVGDVHHFYGVQSTRDPLWMTNYELIYSHPELMLPWYPVLGNHEYRGNTQAVLDYAQVSRRWMMPARYYTKVFNEDGCSLRIVFLDTTPLIDSYRADSLMYPDAHQQDREAELNWLDSVLRNAKEDWVICVGHHPIYAETGKKANERLDMQKYLLPVLKRYRNVAVYGCGHIHNFQYIKMPKDQIDYWVNSAAALSRPVKPTQGTVWCDPSSGFSVISVKKDVLNIYAINKEGKVLYTLSKRK